LKGKHISAILFFLFLLIFPLCLLLFPKESFSENENRLLAEPPQLTLRNLVSTKFMTDTEDYISDHFIYRDLWVSAKSRMEFLTGKRELNRVFVGKDALFENLDRPNDRYVRLNASAISDFVERVGKPSYLMVVPTSAAIQGNRLPTFAGVWDQKAFIDSFYSEMPQQVKCVDIYSAFLGAANEYIYYRTDHHWTSLGAYYAYNSVITEMGQKPYAKNQFNIEHVSYDFNGTYFSKAKFEGITPDSIDYYHCTALEREVEVAVNNGKNVQKFNTPYFREYLTQKDKYASFLGPNQPVVTVTAVTDETHPGTGKSLLIFKDSFAHSLLPFLTLHYDKITLVDLRYTKNNYENYISGDISDYDQILFLYGISSVANANDPSML